MRLYELFNLIETSSSGSSSAGNIASINGRKSTQGTIGAGFNANGDYGIYPRPKKRVILSKSSIIRRS